MEVNMKNHVHPEPNGNVLTDEPRYAVGARCPNCGFKLVEKSHPPNWQPKSKQHYHYRRWFACNKCLRIYTNQCDQVHLGGQRHGTATADVDDVAPVVKIENRAEHTVTRRRIPKPGDMVCGRCQEPQSVATGALAVMSYPHIRGRHLLCKDCVQRIAHYIELELKNSVAICTGTSTRELKHKIAQVVNTLMPHIPAIDAETTVQTAVAATAPVVLTAAENALRRNAI